MLINKDACRYGFNGKMKDNEWAKVPDWKFLQLSEDMWGGSLYQYLI